MIKKVNEILQELIGLSLIHTTRASNMECLKFGTSYLEDHKENPQNYGEFGLHIQCPWRLTNDKEIIVGSDDLYEQADEKAEYDENFDWEIFDANLRDIKLHIFISTHQNIVISAIADKFGGLQIIFDNNTTLTVFPVIASRAENEYWRLLDNRQGVGKHYVSKSIGYEIN